MHTQPVQSREPGEPIIYEPFNGPLEWQIPSSESVHAPYVVNLGAFGCRGSCQCRWWITTVGPKVKKGKWVSCKHIQIARQRFTDWIIRELAKRDPNRQHDIDQVER